MTVVYDIELNSAAHYPVGGIVELSPLIGAIAIVVLVAQANSWEARVRATAAAVATMPAGCVQLSDVEDVRATPLDHWSTTSLLLLREGPAPDQLVAAGFGCAEAVDGQGLLVKRSGGGPDDRLPLDGLLSLDSLADRVRGR